MPPLTATYKLEIDWDGDGVFEAVEDVSDDLAMGQIIARGYASPLARLPYVGRMSLTLRNDNKAYSPPLDADVVPWRGVRLTMSYGGQDVVLFAGYVDEIKPAAGEYRGRETVIECVDAMALLDGHEGPMAIQTNVYADEVIEAAVNAVYTPASTDYEKGRSLFPFSADRWGDLGEASGWVRGSAEEVQASVKIGAACASDWGRFFIAKDGTPTFFNRHHMPLDVTAELTLSNDMLEMGYRKGSALIYNWVEVTCYPRSAGTVYEVLGALSQQWAPVIEASSAETFVLRYRDPSNPAIYVGGKDAVTPTSDDYECTSDPAGEGTDESANVTPSAAFYADRAEITLTNAAAYPVWVQKLQVRGYAIRARRPVTKVVSDAGSISSYGKRKLPVDAPLMSDATEARLLAEYLLDFYKDPRDDVFGIEILANHDATWMAAVRDLELMDRVVITEDQVGLSAFAGYIYQMEHRINSPQDHRLGLAIHDVPALGTPFRLDTSALNSGHVLIY